MSDTGIYIHVPFCARKCGYCDFYSGKYSREDSEGYVKAVIRNLESFSYEELSASTVYFGGGTPSLLSSQQLRLIMDSVRSSFQLLPEAEITLEANPSTINDEKLSGMLEAGINRLSLGVQSMNSDELRFLGRSHSPERAEKAVRDAAAAGFGNISCDLMTALPGQTEEKLLCSIDRLSELPLQHISAYILKVEEGTPFFHSGVGEILPDDDSSAQLYLTMVKALEERGFMQYEVSNFARPGFESRHNCRYWKCQDYIGIGPSAHSCHGGKRYAAEADIRSFIASPLQEVYVTDESPCGFEEYSMLRLRLKEGLRLEDVQEHRSDIEKKLPQLMREGYAEFDGETVSLTPKGFLMSNSVIEYLIF